MANLMVNAGRAIMSGLVSGVTSLIPKNVGIGSGAGTTAVGDTTLFTEYTTGTWTGYARTANAGVQQTTSVTNDTFKFTGTFTAGAAQTVTNAGCFDAASAGNMLIKGDFTGVALATNDSITINITCQFS
jgi:hypothetical protein